MSNWNFHKNRIGISWYNLYNDPTELKYKRKTLKIKDYFKNIFRVYAYDYGIEFDHMYDRTCLIFSTPKYLYWVLLRDSDTWKDKGKWCFKFLKTANNHIMCG